MTFRTGDRIIRADHDKVEFGRVIDRCGNQYRVAFPDDEDDWSEAHWSTDGVPMRFVKAEDSAIARALDEAEKRITVAETEVYELRETLASQGQIIKRLDEILKLLMRLISRVGG